MNPTNILRKLHRNTTVVRRNISARFGENIYSRSDEWDILIIIDAARYDIIQEIASGYDYLQDVERIKSRGSSSQEWAYNTFIRDADDFQTEIRKTNYISDNILASLVLSGVHEKNFIGGEYIEDNIEQLVEKLQDSSLGKKQDFDGFNPVFMKRDKTVGDEKPRNPRILSNHLLDAVQKEESEKTIAHYMIPHIPFFNANREETRTWPDKMINVDNELYNDLIRNYKMNHRFILDHLKTVLARIPTEYDIVITADHGNIIGSPLGINCTLTHPEYMLFPRGLRDPPWIHTDQSLIDDKHKSFETLSPDETSSPSQTS